MITRITNNEGKECFAIVFNEHTDIFDVLNIQSAVLGVLQASTHSDLFEGLKDDIYTLFELLLETLPTEAQIKACRNSVFPKTVQP